MKPAMTIIVPRVTQDRCKGDLKGLLPHSKGLVQIIFKIKAVEAIRLVVEMRHNDQVKDLTTIHKL